MNLTIVKIKTHSGENITLSDNSDVTQGVLFRFVQSIFALLINKNVKGNITIYYFPIPIKYMIFQKLNIKLFNLFIRLLKQRLPPVKMLWILDPQWYWLHNIIRWEYLVFDCSDELLYVRYTHYKQSFLDGYFFLYHVSANHNIREIKVLKKSNKINTESLIYSYIK